MHCLFSTFPYFSLLIVWKGAISGFGMMAWSAFRMAKPVLSLSWSPGRGAQRPLPGIQIYKSGASREGEICTSRIKSRIFEGRGGWSGKWLASVDLKITRRTNLLTCRDLPEKLISDICEIGWMIMSQLVACRKTLHRINLAAFCTKKSVQWPWGWKAHDWE
jgi:hypothetical protein